MKMKLKGKNTPICFIHEYETLMIPNIYDALTLFHIGIKSMVEVERIAKLN